VYSFIYLITITKSFDSEVVFYFANTLRTPLVNYLIKKLEGLLLG